MVQRGKVLVELLLADCTLAMLSKPVLELAMKFPMKKKDRQEITCSYPNGKGSWGQGSRYRSSSIKGFISEGTLNRSNGSVTNHSGSPSKGRPLESMLPSSEIVATSPSPSFSIGTCNYLCEAWVATNSFISADEILPERTSIH